METKKTEIKCFDCVHFDWEYAEFFNKTMFCDLYNWVNEPDPSFNNCKDFKPYKQHDNNPPYIKKAMV